VFNFSGEKYVDKFGLRPLTGDAYSNSYDSSVDPRISNEFAAAAYRFGHGLIPAELVTFDAKVNRSMRELFNRPQAAFDKNGREFCKTCAAVVC
jgi:hypothetical protein